MNPPIDIFKLLDSKKGEKREAYTPETIDLFKRVFWVIWEEFDEKVPLRTQLRGYKKKEYDKMVSYLKNIIVEEKELEGSMKVGINKMLEGEIFRHLEDIHSYNTFCNKENETLKKQIDNSIDYIYRSESTEQYVKTQELELKIDNKIYKKPEDIREMIGRNGKKSKIILFKKNIEYNKVLEKFRVEAGYKRKGNSLKNKYENQAIIPEYEIRLPEKIISASLLEEDNKEIIIDIESIKFITENINQLPILDNKYFLKYFLLKESFYFSHKNYLRAFEDNMRVIIPLNYQALTKRTATKYIDVQRNIEFFFSEEIRYFWFLKERNYKRIKFIRDCNWIKYTNSFSIQNFLNNCKPETVFQVGITQHGNSRVNTILAALDFNLFFALNPNMIKSLSFEGEKVDRGRYIVKPISVNLQNFAAFVDTFLERLQKEYNTLYENTRLIDISLPSISPGFESYKKNNIKNSREIFDVKLRKVMMSSRFFPKSLEE